MQEKSITIKDKTLFYRTIGEGPCVLVLVHGFGEDGRIWNGLIKSLKNYRLIVPDLPGSGRSEMIDDMSMDGMADVLQKLVVHETATVFYREGEPGSVVMIGHSMGGYITLAFAEKYPAMLRGFGLFHSTAFADSAEKIETRRKGIRFIEENGAFAFLKTTIPNLYSPETKEKNPTLVEEQIIAGHGLKSEALIAYYEGMIARPDRTHVLKESRVPVLFIMGKYDNAVPLADGLKQCHLPATSFIHILEHSGHMGMQEEGDLAKSALSGFLSHIYQ